VSKARSSVVLSAASIFGLGLNFLALPWLIRWLGPAEWGLLLYFQTLSLYVGLIDIGFTNGAIKRMAEAFGDEDRAQAWKVQRCLFWVQLALGTGGLFIFALLALGVATSASFAAFLLPTTNEHIYRLEWLLPLIGTSFWINAATGALTPVFVAGEKFGSMAVRDAIQRVLSLALGLIAARTYGTLFAYLLASNIGAVLGFLLNFVTLRRAFPDFALRPQFDKHVFRDLSIIGGRSYVHRIGSMLANSVHIPLMAKAGGAVLPTQYQLAGRVPEAIKAIVDPISQTVLPHLTREAAKDRQLFARSVERYSMIGLGLGISLILVPAGFGSAILAVWAKNNPALTPVSHIVLLLLGIYFTFELFFIMLTKAFYALGTLHYMAPFSLFNAAATLVLTVPVVRNFGLVGIAVQNVAIDLAQLVPMLWVVKRYAAPDLRLWSQLRNILIAMGVGVGVALGAFWLVNFEPIASHPWLALAFIPIASAVTFALLATLRPVPLPEDLRRVLGRSRVPVE
jgi:O-antigen/teichoic acid export membrane protein